MGVAPGFSEFFHFVKFWTVCKGSKYAGPPRMLGRGGLEKELFELGEFGFDRANPVVKRLGDFGDRIENFFLDHNMLSSTPVIFFVHPAYHGSF